MIILIRCCGQCLAFCQIVTHLLGNCVSLACCVHVCAFAPRLHPAYTQAYACVIVCIQWRNSVGRHNNVVLRFQKLYGRLIDPTSARGHWMKQRLGKALPTARLGCILSFSPRMLQAFPEVREKLGTAHWPESEALTPTQSRSNHYKGEPSSVARRTGRSHPQCQGPSTLLVSFVQRRATCVHPFISQQAASAERTHDCRSYCV